MSIPARVHLALLVAACGAIGASASAAPPPVVSREVPIVRRPSDPCAPDAVKAELRAAVAAVPRGGDVGAAVQSTFTTRATACLTAQLGWVSAAKDDATTWSRVRGSAAELLYLWWAGGVLQGTKPDDAYLVRCDRSTMTQADIDAGRVVLVYGGAVVKPAEFVIGRVILSAAP